MGSCYCTEYAADQRDTYLYPFPVNGRKGGGVVAVVAVLQMLDLWRQRQRRRPGGAAACDA